MQVISSARRVLLLICVLPLPLGAQEIMSYEEYQRIDRDEPYVLRLCDPTGTGHQLYFGSRHSNDPADPQMQRVADALRSIKTDVVLTEGGELEIEGLTREDAIRRFGEFGLTRWLALADGTRVETLDPPRVAEIAHPRDEAGFTVPQLKLFYTLHHVAQSRRSGAPPVDFDAAVPRYLQHLSNERGLPGAPETLVEFEDAVRRLLPDVTDWRQIPEQFFYPGPQEPTHFTNEVQTASNDFRDRYHVRRLVQLVDTGKKIFAIVGSTHVVMREPALRKLLRECP